MDVVNTLAFVSCTVYLEIVGGEGANDLWRNVQAWRTRQREAAVQIFATHSLLYQPVNQCTTQQSASRTTSHKLLRPNATAKIKT